VACVERLPNHPLFQRLLDVDPELIVPYIIDRLGTTQRSAVAVLDRLIADGRADGSIAADDPDGMAYSLQLVLQPFVFSARITEKEHPMVGVSAQLRRLLNAYLSPDSDRTDHSVEKPLRHVKASA
jgi:hypothetical protein